MSRKAKSRKARLVESDEEDIIFLGHRKNDEPITIFDSDDDIAGSSAKRCSSSLNAAAGSDSNLHLPSSTFGSSRTRHAGAPASTSAAAAPKSLATSLQFASAAPAPDSHLGASTSRRKLRSTLPGALPFLAMSASDTGLSASSSSASWRVQAARKGPSNAIASLDDSDEEDTTEPERPSTEEEEQDFVLFMAKQGELPEDEEDEEEEHGIPQVLNEEQIVNDLLSATGNGEVDESTYGQENKFLGIDDIVRAIKVLASLAPDPDITISPIQLPTLRYRFQKCLDALGSRTSGYNNNYTRIMSLVPVETQFRVFCYATELSEHALLAAASPPTEAQIKVRAAETPAFNDQSWMSYTLVFLATADLPLTDYEGSANAMPSTSPGGGEARSVTHLAALRRGTKAKIYEAIRAAPGQVGMFLNARFDVNGHDRRSAVLTAVRVCSQYICEAVRHEWCVSFHPSSRHFSTAAGHEWWPNRPTTGTNMQTPALQGMRWLPPLPVADRLNNARQAARSKWSSDWGRRWRRAYALSPKGREARAKYYSSELHWRTLRRWRKANIKLVRSYEHRCRAKFKANLKIAEEAVAAGADAASLPDAQRRALTRRSNDVARDKEALCRPQGRPPRPQSRKGRWSYGQRPDGAATQDAAASRPRQAEEGGAEGAGCSRRGRARGWTPAQRSREEGIRQSGEQQTG
ncbi:hypothetical protein A1Q1_02101 [Trichosporon asahii var. asahii CBS 2479]|uniref:Uncharacterized protein n=1 Tax=Trichosporon asahii var. asahii (strain ATCC 90039 / CBS 2479 / JCM 2466 / KCTC 7840 / NBRC 103889/ NCYC 2677 / UAMH 7654) TaxID=1186058 RepID=J5TTM5_TRIAS|nr:hypothetical protein A1Q1_02101 [Trichosporon asahii var. asahii CBS 2479]EJT52766.1 hypothetical protein A1Q1_02101 [Trichosporon asahii var. asahii CBS 2479]